MRGRRVLIPAAALVLTAALAGAAPRGERRALRSRGPTSSAATPTPTRARRASTGGASSEAIRSGAR